MIPKDVDWITPITSYLKNETLPKDCEESRRLKIKATHFMLYLRCLIPNEADYIMREVHEGLCRIHLRARSLVHKLIRAGYYWLTMQKDAHSYIKACDKCQCFSNVVRQLLKPFTLMNAPWPFTKCDWTS